MSYSLTMVRSEIANATISLHMCVCINFLPVLISFSAVFSQAKNLPLFL